MPTPNGVWTPRNTTRKFPFRVVPPKITYPYKAPPRPRKRITIEEAMTPEGAETLARMAQAWLDEAARLERETPHPTLEILIGDILQVQNVALDRLLASWDPSGNGALTKGEFRSAVRSLGLAGTTSADIDALFEKYDGDASGKIEIAELKVALVLIKDSAKEHRVKVMEPRERAERLRMRAEAAVEASKAVAQAEKLEAELDEFKSQLDGSLDVQLGHVLHRRKIRIGDIVGEWPESRQNELTRAEWRKHVSLLFPTPPTIASLDSVFDQIDSDSSGFLDVKEAKAALKELQARAKAATEELEMKTDEATRVRRRASKKAQIALHEPSSKPPSPHLSENAPALPSDDDGGSPTSVFSRRMSSMAAMFAASPRKTDGQKKDDAERKKAAAERAQKALHALCNLKLSKGWQSWVAWHEERREKLHRMGKALIILSNVELMRGYSTWARWYEERTRTLNIMRSGLTSLMMHDVSRGLRGWTAWLADVKEGERIRRVAARGAASLKGPLYLALFDFWRQEQKLAALERGDFLLAATGPRKGSKGAAPGEGGGGGGGGAAASLCNALTQCLATK